MNFVLFVQHGWADNHLGMAHLGRLLQSPIVIAPNLGWWKTWWRIEPLIAKVYEEVTITANTYPHLPWRIVGHSMGGLIWLELLDRFPFWRSRVQSLVLIGSPVAGSEVARMIDPFYLGIGIASDLGRDRRPIAERIASEIPTLTIASDLYMGTDGIVSIRSTQFNQAQHLLLPGITHPGLRFDAQVVASISSFWQKSAAPMSTFPVPRLHH